MDKGATVADASDKLIFGHLITAARLIPDGQVQTGCIVSDGAQVRESVLIAFKKSRAYDSTMEALRAIHRRIGRPNIASCECGLIICPTLAVLEGVSTQSHDLGSGHD